MDLAEKARKQVFDILKSWFSLTHWQLEGWGGREIITSKSCLQVRDLTKV